MDTNTSSVQLGLLSNSDIQRISQIKAACQCLFSWKSFDSHSKSNFQKVTLQLRDDYVVQVQPIRKIIICGFKCEYDVNFEIVRNHSEIPHKLGVPQTLEFVFKKQNLRKVSLVVENIKELQKFCHQLEKLYIVQLGFRESFKAVKILGKGVTATVYKAIRHSDQQDVAIKSFKRAVYFSTQNGMLSFQKQFKILSALKHDNICKLQGVYETENSTYIVMEHLQLSLFGWIQKYGFPNFENAKKMIVHLLRGLQYLHSKGIMHRDLKLQNIMVRKDSNQNIEVVIVDLGLAQYINETKFLYTRCGTPGYVAPQILKTKSNDGEKYNEACDIFSLGVIFHILFFKKPIFQGTQVKQVIKKNTECNINFNAQHFNSIPVQGLELLKKMLQKDPNKRILASQALNNEFLKIQSTCISPSLPQYSTSIQMTANNYI